MGFQKLLACLIACEHNMRILHWCVKGIDFDPVHVLLGSYYEQLGDYVDTIAELGMQININPIGMVEAIRILEADDSNHEILSGTELLDSKTVFQKIDVMFGMLLDTYDKVLNNMSLTGDIINKLQEHQQWLRLEKDFKNKHRLS